MEIQALIKDHLESVDFPSSQVKSTTSSDPDLHSSSNTLNSSTHTLSQLPVELLEVVLSCLADPISQRRLSQVRMTMCGVVNLTEKVKAWCSGLQVVEGHCCQVEVAQTHEL